jgi:hypothetical protein
LALKMTIWSLKSEILLSALSRDLPKCCINQYATVWMPLQPEDREVQKRHCLQSGDCSASQLLQ